VERVHSTAVDHSNGVKIGVTHRRSRTAYTIEVRAYNDGIAFRHIVPGEERACRTKPPSPSARGKLDLVHRHGERLRRPVSGSRVVNPVNLGIRISDVCRRISGASRDFMLPDGTGYASITEGRLRHYSGMGLQADDSGGLHARLAHAVETGWVFRKRI